VLPQCSSGLAALAPIKCRHRWPGFDGRRPLHQRLRLEAAKEAMKAPHEGVC